MKLSKRPFGNISGAALEYINRAGYVSFVHARGVYIMNESNRFEKEMRELIRKHPRSRRETSERVSVGYGKT